MAKIDKAVFDSGPLIHLSQIDALDVLKSVKKIMIPYGVFEEIKLENQNSRLIKKIRIVKLSKNFKDISKIISEKYSLGLGESLFSFPTSGRPKRLFERGV